MNILLGSFINLICLENDTLVSWTVSFLMWTLTHLFKWTNVTKLLVKMSLYIHLHSAGHHIRISEIVLHSQPFYSSTSSATVFFFLQNIFYLVLFSQAYCTLSAAIWMVPCVVSLHSWQGAEDCRCTLATVALCTIMACNLL